MAQKMQTLQSRRLEEPAQRGVGGSLPGEKANHTDQKSPDAPPRRRPAPTEHPGGPERRPRPTRGRCSVGREGGKEDRGKRGGGGRQGVHAAAGTLDER